MIRNPSYKLYYLEIETDIWINKASLKFNSKIDQTQYSLKVSFSELTSLI